MNRLEEILTEMQVETLKLSFSGILRKTREKLGIRQYRAAEYLKMPMSRLKNLENGFFAELPKSREFKEFSELYKIPYEFLVSKAQKQVNARKRLMGKEVKND